MYESQTHSKAYRDLGKTFGKYFQTERAFEQIYIKHFKQQYAGKPTKKYLKLSQQIQNAEKLLENCKFVL
ncbi:MAG: hypothetical protein IPN36_16440 [Bacteroidetes bacterium]|nr:hypothetical protein [Bacteroidota bacterium]